MLTVLSWFWKQPNGRTNYSARHVNIWAAMVRRNLTIPHRIACVTSTPEGIDPSVEIIKPPGDFEDVRIGTWREHLPQCLRRIAMFRPDAADIFGEWFVSMDLDCIVTGSLDSVFEERCDFRMFRGTSKSRPYNGSMMMLTAGARPQVYTEFTQEGAEEAGRKYIGSDQAWISHVLGSGERVWDDSDGVTWWPRCSEYPEDKMRVVFFPGNAKPWEITGKRAWAGKNYRISSKPGRCIILGYGPSVWDDFEAALSRGPYDAIIASPEAADHWPGEILEIARYDDEALGLAYSHGFDDIVFCGRTGRVAA